MAVHSDSGVVLRRLEYSETSQIVVLFTRAHGKVRAIAKGIRKSTRKRFAVGMDLLEVGTVSFSIRQPRPETLAKLTEWRQTRFLAGLRARLDRLHGAMYLAEIVASLTEDWDPHEDVYDALIEALAKLAASDEPLYCVARFQEALLLGVGSLPRFDACVICSAVTDLKHFSSNDGGLVCAGCARGRAEHRRVSGETMSAFRCGSWPNRPVGVFRLLDYHISHLMGRETRLGRKLLASGEG